MKKILNLFVFLFVILILSNNKASGQVNPDRQWTSYRGKLSSGVLDNTNLPDSFDLKSMTNVKWKTEIPGLGLSSPVVWGNRYLLQLQ